MDRVIEFQSMWDGHLERVNTAKHRIELRPENTQPIYCTPLWAGQKAREFEKTEIEEMLPKKVIEPTQTEWAAPIVFTLKKDGYLRFCVEYRKSHH